MTHLYLIRHAESYGNAKLADLDTSGTNGITPKGLAQAERLRDRLAATGEIQADVLLSSYLARAVQTAEIIAPALGLPLTFEKDLQEIDMGDSAGMTRDEAAAKYGAVNFREEPFRPRSPQAESLGQFRLRAATVLARIVRDYPDKTIVAVTHGGIIDASFHIFFGVMASMAASCVPDNTAITHWQYYHSEKFPALWRLKSFNDTKHLD